ncbi:MAG: alpha/beta fold hydrolase [Desulfobacteraceae bacterium]|nr:alpha/beta fold hydrolase [Desulfobacteraceae bacterium]
MKNAFSPLPFLKNKYLQTALSSSRVRTWRPSALRTKSVLKILELDDGVRLSGAYTTQHQRPPKGVVILIHGWEGSMDSAYIQATGRTLYNNGYNVFRLNLRDHGDSHHLNDGLFFATRLPEACQAVSRIAEMSAGLPVFLTGFSLGGNFALRIARQCAEKQITHLKHIVAVSPVLDPDRATDAVDNEPMILRYFLKKWFRSLRKKETLFPALYDFSDVYNMSSIRDITDALVPRFSMHKDTAEYFSKYTLNTAQLKEITIPTTIVTAADDPIIPVEDFHNLRLGPGTEIIIHDHGGHNGFIDGWLFSTWYEKKMTRLFQRHDVRC